MIFHIVTDRKTYTSMHAWSSMNPIKLAIVEFKGLHHHDWSHEVNVGLKQMLQIRRLIWSYHCNTLKQYGFILTGYLQALQTNWLSLISHLRIFISKVKKVDNFEHLGSTYSTSIILLTYCVPNSCFQNSTRTCYWMMI